MKRAYVVYGMYDVTNERVDAFYAVCHSMERADELCLEAEAEDTDGRIYSWAEVIEEDDA